MRYLSLFNLGLSLRLTSYEGTDMIDTEYSTCTTMESLTRRFLCDEIINLTNTLICHIYKKSTRKDVFSCIYVAFVFRMLNFIN